MKSHYLLTPIWREIRVSFNVHKTLLGLYSKTVLLHYPNQL